MRRKASPSLMKVDQVAPAAKMIVPVSQSYTAFSRSIQGLWISHCIVCCIADILYNTTGQSLYYILPHLFGLCLYSVSIVVHFALPLVSQYLCSSFSLFISTFGFTFWVYLCSSFFGSHLCIHSHVLYLTIWFAQWATFLASISSMYISSSSTSPFSLCYNVLIHMLNATIIYDLFSEQSSER